MIETMEKLLIWLIVLFIILAVMQFVLLLVDVSRETCNDPRLDAIRPSIAERGEGEDEEAIQEASP